LISPKNRVDFQGNTQIAFGTESEWLNYNSADNSKPQKLYARSYALGGLDFTVGLKFKINMVCGKNHL
jgi:hypothetical protein